MVPASWRVGSTTLTTGAGPPRPAAGVGAVSGVAWALSAKMGGDTGGP
jgi:hypothetical protein